MLKFATNSLSSAAALPQVSYTSLLETKRERERERERVQYGSMFFTIDENIPVIPVTLKPIQLEKQDWRSPLQSSL